jgi:hypothetical protein
VGEFAENLPVQHRHESRIICALILRKLIGGRKKDEISLSPVTF